MISLLTVPITGIIFGKKMVAWEVEIVTLILQVKLCKDIIRFYGVKGYLSE